MEKRVNNLSNNMENSNINNSGDSSSFKGIEIPAKTYKWCWKCSGSLEEGSITPFCCFGCQQEYYAENAREIDAVWREISGRD